MSAKSQIVIATLVGAVVGIVMLRAISSGATASNVTWKFPGGSLTMDVKQDLSNPDTMLKKLFQTDYSREGTLGILRTSNIYRRDDPQLVDALAELCPDRAPTETREGSRARLDQCLQVPVIARLRERADNHRAPFQYVGQTIHVGIPEADENRPTDSHANACRNGNFYGRTGQLIN